MMKMSSFSQILTVLCYFWLTKAKYDFFASKKYFMKMSQITKVIYETLVNLLVLDKFLLYHMGLRPIFREITSICPVVPFRITRFFVWFNLNHTRILIIKSGLVLGFEVISRNIGLSPIVYKGNLFRISKLTRVS